MVTTLEPQDLEPIQQELQLLKEQMTMVLIVLKAFDYVSRIQAKRILDVSDEKLKKLGDTGVLEYEKGKRLIFYSMPSIINYLLKVKHIKPEALGERIKA